jgi:hypothetical protein
MNPLSLPADRLPPPLQDVSAWYGPALKAQGDWLERLDAAEVPPGAKPWFEIAAFNWFAGQHRLAHSALERPVRRAVAWTSGGLNRR